ncbi:MAG: hypothetical protein H7145_12805, partial [Akkermansiaceae bacterium]|nr:hypothetical protein [Armatimonadota bacterium]
MYPEPHFTAVLVYGIAIHRPALYNHSTTMERTFTFLFTDIEGSTRMWDEQPEAMSHALRWHDDLLRRAIAESGGQTFKTVGDAFCAAFETQAQAA